MLPKVNVLSAALALAFGANALAQDDVPVIDLGGGPASSRQPELQQYSSYSASRNSELMVIVQQLQDEVRALRGQVEQQDHRIRQMERQQLDRYRDLDRRITSAQQGAPATSHRPPPTGVEPTRQPVGASQTPSATPQPSAASSDAKAYREAFGLVRASNYPKAIKAFKAFIKDYPQSARIANAHYWLGEIYLAEQKPELARESFVQVLTHFPKHRKAPDAAYKLGVVYDQLGDRAKSVKYLDMVINQYPNSSAVRLAKEFKRLQ